MTVLVIENYPGTTIGRIAGVLGARGVAVERVAPHEGAAVPLHPGQSRGLIVLGGGQNALDDAGSPWLPDVLRLIGAFHVAERPVMGICLGAQLIARAFGGQNIIGRPLEFGYAPVTPTAEAATDPVLSALTAPEPLFHWHSDTMTLPPGAVHLAASAMTPLQAFRLGTATYGLQFHLEVDEPLVDHWITSAAAHLDEGAPDWRTRFPAERTAHAARAGELGDAITANWADLL